MSGLYKRRVDVVRLIPPHPLSTAHGSTMSANATTSIPSDAPGCWANSESAVSTCCSQLGGVRLQIPDSAVAACAYNVGAKFTADDGSSNSTTGRWSSCITSHFNTTIDGSVVLSTCVNTQNQTATVTSTPSSTATSGAEELVVFRRGGGVGRGVLAGFIVGSGLVHVLSLAL
ncbi:hypothetical protein DFH06DRAFT_1291432 [Mycena polygramma]|nr:hypothetical protein DFH06DRAFT_1291432 [Mycena polygramma]